jgi:hypothetical protein
MQKAFLPMLGFSALLLACHAEPQAADTGAKTSPSMAQKPDPDMDAQTELDAAVADAGSQQASALCDEMRCKRQGEQLAQVFMMSEAISLKVDGGDCRRVDIDGLVVGMACTCQTSNGWLYIGPKGAGCYVRGRAGDCLWDDKEFEPCTVGDPKCHTICRELERRYAADAAKTFEVEIRSSTCKNDSCRHVLRLDSACYTDRSIESGRRFDCSLSDAEILEREDNVR